MPRRIGILGGMGPEATVDLMRRVIAAVPASDDADHVPMIVDNNTEVPSRIAHLVEGTGADPTPVLVRMARVLEATGAEALAMPCNSAHSYATAIAEAVEIPFLNMVELTAAKVAAMTDGRIGMLASPAVQSSGLFDRALGALGLEAVYSKDETAMLRVIREVKQQGVSAASERVLQGASRQLLAEGARVQLVACSEFSLLADPVAEDAVKVDTIDVLVDAILEFAGR